MIRRIELKNFMSHSHTVIELADGLSVLIGDNNSGKSAVVAALQAVCQNASGSYMVRHGESECEVAIETEEGHRLIWRRHKGKVSYVVNGREVDRLKGGVPGDLHELLRLPPVLTSRDSFDVHVGEQKQPIFLLADKASDRAAFFASSSDTCKLIEMQELHRTRSKESKRELKRNLDERNKINERLEQFAELDDIEHQIDSLTSGFESIERSDFKQAEIARHLNSAAEFRNQIEKYRSIRLTLASMKPLPEFKISRPIRTLIGQLAKAHTEIVRNRKELEVLNKLDPPPKLENSKSLRNLISQMESSKQQVAKYSSAGNAFLGLKKPPTKDHFKPTSILQSTIKDLEKANRSKVSMGELLSKTCDDLELAEADLRAKFEEFESCPTCKQRINVEYSLTRSKIELTPNKRLASIATMESETDA